MLIEFIYILDGVEYVEDFEGKLKESIEGCRQKGLELSFCSNNKKTCNL